MSLTKKRARASSSNPPYPPSDSHPPISLGQRVTLRPVAGPSHSSGAYAGTGSSPTPRLSSSSSASPPRHSFSRSDHPRSPHSPSSYLPFPHHSHYTMSSPLPSPNSAPPSSASPALRWLRKRAGLRNTLFLLLFAAVFTALWILVQPKEVDLTRYAQGAAGGRVGYTPQRPGSRTSSGGDSARGRPGGDKPESRVEEEETRGEEEVLERPSSAEPSPADSPPASDEADVPPETEPADPAPSDDRPPGWQDPKQHRFPPIENERPREIDLHWWVDHGATWFLEPIPALLSAPAPSTFQCSNDPAFGPLLLIAVFSTAKSWEKRDLIRVLGRRGLGPSLHAQVQFRFVIGRTQEQEWEDRMELESRRHGDIVRLEFPENMDEGKTYQFFRWVGERPEGERPRFAMKTDDDTFLVLPNLLQVIDSLDCNQNIYFGTSWGACITNCYPFYMRGMAYGLSWPLISWLTAANLPYDDYRSTEDARTGSWFLSLPEGEKMQVVDLERRLGDWDGISIPINGGTVALHAMKSNWLWAEIGLQVIKAWEQEGKEYLFPSEKQRRAALPDPTATETGVETEREGEGEGDES